MNGFKPPGRSRPTNNQLLYKAYFRWKHYDQELEAGTELPVGTEACASVTSAFLQILATIHNVEACRVKKPRNILSILSTNTRRTKVVELSTGTHRVADELRRHSLSDGMGGHYSTNLDRNRYGSDNNYLFTVTKYNLECLGMCPCLVDIEIVDTRNGNEAQLVTAGHDACSCDSPERAELADVSHFAGSNPRQSAQASTRREMRRVSSAGNVTASGMRRVGSAQHLRRAPSSGRLFDQGPAHSRGNSGSELFDALLMAATGEVQDTKSQGEAPVSSRQRSVRNRTKVWASHDAMEHDFDDDDILARTGSIGKPRSKTIPRRNSVSMIIENPVLAQTGAGDSLLMGQYFGGDREGSAHSDQGDTEHGQEMFHDGGDNVTSEKGQLPRFNKQSSAVNLARLGGGAAEARRLAGELRQLREERRQLELALEESRSSQKQAEKDAEEAKAAARKAADIAESLRKAAEKSNIKLDDEIVQASKYLPTSEQEIELLKAEMAEIKSELQLARIDRRDFDGKSKGFAGGLPKGMPNSQAAAAAAAAAAFAQMPYAMSMLPMFAGMPPLNPYGGMPGSSQMPPIPPSTKGFGSMQKVASMPAIYQGIMSPPSDRDQKRKAENLEADDNDQDGYSEKKRTNLDHGNHTMDPVVKEEDNNGLAGSAAPKAMEVER